MAPASIPSMAGISPDRSGAETDWQSGRAVLGTYDFLLAARNAN